MNRVGKLSLGAGVISVILLIFSSSILFSKHLVYAQSCTVPTQVTNAAITFPNCVDGTCNYAQGSCSWSAVTGATGYNVIITAVSTNTQVLNQLAYTSTTTTFPVTTSDTYRCDVSAVNSCGTGTVGTSSLLCNTEFVASPTVTGVPTTTIPASAPRVTMVPTGSNDFVWSGFAGFAMIIIGFSILLLL